VRITEEFDVARDLLASVRDYTQAKIAEGQADVAKKLTVIASLALVPSFIVGLRPERRGRVRTAVVDGGHVDGADRDDDDRAARSLPGWRRWI
jgi:hypothetical protein